MEKKATRYRSAATVVLLTFSSISSLEAACTKTDHATVNLTQYYADTASLSGDELKLKLNTIIRNHKKYSYTPCVWEILKEADEDPNNPDSVVGIYTGRSIAKADQDDGSNQPNDWNREHIWAKSHGFPNKSQHAYTDAHHLRAADRSVNTDRSNNDFDNGGELDDECTNCREGDHTWEPPLRVKGDIARMMFYMATRYEGNDNSNTPNLELVDRKTSSGEPFFGKLCTLLAWHFQDGVNDKERKRNDIIHSWQGNRNPFIDHPEFVSRIWRESCDLTEQDITVLEASNVSHTGQPEYENAWTGIPTNIHDGDTFKIGSSKFRLWGYDSPESRQDCFDASSSSCVACGTQARDALRNLIKDKSVTCFDIGERTYGRVVANCYVDETNINHWMVLHGWGVALDHYTLSWKGAEAIAIKHKRGIWKYDFIDPYRWRQGVRLSQCE